MRTLAALLLALLLSACQPPPHDSTAVVGATLLDAQGKVIHEYCMVVVKEGKYSAVGSQAMVPLPKTAERIDGLRKYLVASERWDGQPAQSMQDVVTPEVGKPAALALLNKDPRKDPSAFRDPAWSLHRSDLLNEKKN